MKKAIRPFLNPCKGLFILGLCLLLSFSADAKLTVPSLFSDHMVLQQKASARIWGSAEAGQKVNLSASWSALQVSVYADEQGKWLAQVKTPQAGGPYQVKISANEEVLILTDVLIGEVWLCSGQSNMVWGAAFGHKEMLDELPASANSRIRLLSVGRNSSDRPLDTLKDSWSLCNPESAGKFTAVGYFVAKALAEKLNVPIGIISSCAGSTTVENWSPGGLYWNAMLKPLIGYRIAGVYWYQGESNVITFEGYETLFKKMVGSWRKDWGHEFPFYYVQIAPYAYIEQGVSGNKAAFLREQQVSSLSMPKTGLVVTTDLVPNVSEIHPPMKKAIADRLADLSLAEVYGIKMKDYRSPVYNKFKVKGNKAWISFRYVEQGFKIIGDTASELFIAGSDRRFYPAKLMLSGNKWIVFSENVLKPVAVRFGFSDVARPNVFTASGLPVSPFRTDRW